MTSAVGCPIATSRAKEGPDSTAIDRPGTIAARSREIGRPHRGSSPLVADTTGGRRRDERAHGPEHAFDPVRGHRDDDHRPPPTGRAPRMR